MVLGRTLQKALEKFFKSPVVQDSRCQVLLPNGEFYDITGAKLLENKIIGSKETHRLVFLCEKEKSTRETSTEYLYPCCLRPETWACALVPWFWDPGA